MKLENSALTIIKESKKYKLLKKKCCERKCGKNKIVHGDGIKEYLAHNDPRKKIPCQQ
jgi:hypothetical protein